DRVSAEKSRAGVRGAIREQLLVGIEGLPESRRDGLGHPDAFDVGQQENAESQRDQVEQVIARWHRERWRWQAGRDRAGDVYAPTLQVEEADGRNSAQDD